MGDTLNNQRCERGMTWAELVISLALVGIVGIFLYILVVPRGHPPPREAETKAGLHSIHIALERYYTDFNEYPEYLLGGDSRGWSEWHAKWDLPNFVEPPEGSTYFNEHVNDPLIELGYLSSYPENPFTASARQIPALMYTGYEEEHGTGDPRFGFEGTIMGMGLDDPEYFAGEDLTGFPRHSLIETRRTLDHGDYNNVPEYFIHRASNVYYAMGGLINPDSDTDFIKTWWPGNFFYRSTGRPLNTDETFVYPNMGIETDLQHFILGAYGDLKSDGVDVIRLMPYDPDGNPIEWSYPDFALENANNQILCGYGYFDDLPRIGGLPELFGGGDEHTGPQLPYYFLREEYDEVLYGAPDGIPDGVIMVLTDGRTFSPPEGEGQTILLEGESSGESVQEKHLNEPAGFSGNMGGVRTD